MAIIRKLDHKVFADEYKKVRNSGDYISAVRELNVGDSIAIPCDSKMDGSRKRHGIVNDAHIMRKRGVSRKYQTIVKDDEVWVRRVD